MVENLYYLVEDITMIICLFGLFRKRVNINILTMETLVINLIIFNLMLQGYIGKIYSVLELIVVFVYTLYEFKENIKLTLANFFLCIIFITIVQLLSAFPMLIIRKVITNDSMLLLVINLMVMFMILFLKDKLGYISSYISKTKWLSILPIFICFIDIIMLLIQFKNYKSIKFDMYFIILTFTILVLCLINKWYQSKVESELKSNELRVVSTYNNTFDKLVDDVRKRQHNIKNHFNTIYSLHYTCQSYEELIERQKKYCNYIIHTNRFDKLLTGFLYSKFHEVEEYGVQLEYNVKLETTKLPIPMYEIITILGILIDNAREKAEMLEKGEQIVKIDIYENDRYICFKVKNISEYIRFDCIMLFFQKGYSTKGSNRGLGLNIVKQKSLEYDFDTLVENEKKDDQNWIVFGILLKKK